MTLRGRVMVRLMPRFGALLRWVDDGCFVYRFSATARKRYWQIFQHRKQRPLQIPRQRAEARKERNPDTPLQRHPYQLPATTEQDFPFWETKGILRTVGSKSTFAYFSLTRKVGRRRQDKVSIQRRVTTLNQPNPPSERKNFPSGKGGSERRYPYERKTSPP